MPSAASAANTALLGAPRVFYAMASDGVFFKSLARVHPRFETPALAIVVSSIWSAILAFSGTFEQLFTYVVFIGWIFYALAAASIFIYRKREPDARTWANRRNREPLAGRRRTSKNAQEADCALMAV